jgi:hypothetical protein
MSKRSDEAAKRFYSAAGGRSWEYTDHKAKPLIRAAFALYEKEWSGVGRLDILHWRWPFATLEQGKPFEGDEPWTVLFRRAMELFDQDALLPL